jgi:hypothetical protein
MGACLGLRPHDVPDMRCGRCFLCAGGAMTDGKMQVLHRDDPTSSKGCTGASTGPAFFRLLQEWQAGTTL